MSKDRNEKYKPFLTSDANYLKTIAAKIREKPPLEEIKFEYLNDVLRILGINDKVYPNISLENLKSDYIQNLIKKSFPRLKKVKVKDELKNAIDRLWDYLSESDPLEKSDLIFVFGGQGPDRVHEAIKLYKKGYGNKILFTGQKASYTPNVNITEADFYAGIAKKEGIKDENLILEKKAINTVENVLNSIKILKKMNYLPQKIILINHSFQMRRAYLTFKTEAFWNPKLTRRSVAAEKYKKENYYKEIEGWSFVFYEYIKLYGARLMKHF